MPIIRSGEESREIINRIKNSKNSIPCFCTENTITTQAIFIGAKRFKEVKNIKGQIPLMISFTASYKPRPQLKYYSGLDSIKEGIIAVRNDIEWMARENGQFNDLDVIVHLDHAQPGDDEWIFKENKDFISSIMYDCSDYSLKDNIRMVKDFVKEHKKDLVIEGCVDEIYEYNSSNKKTEVKDNITKASDAENYFKETGVDLIVANLGTEHRRTEGALKKYHRNAAQEIKERIGRQIVVHGASSLNDDDIKNLPHDGVVKINIWTVLEASSTGIMVTEILKNIDKILLREKIETLVEEGYLGKRVISKKGKPSLDFLTEKYRRDSIFIPNMVEHIKKYLKNFYIDF